LEHNQDKSPAIDFPKHLVSGDHHLANNPLATMKTVTVLVSAALMAALPAVTAASKDQAKQDQAFIDEAARGGKMEVDLGRLAEQNGSDAKVKQFGAQMVKDHTKLNSELGTVAKSIGLTIPAALSADQLAEYAKLSKLSGPKFDKAYMDLMVSDHTGDLAAFQKEEVATQNPKLKRAVAKAIPIIQEHLNMAKSDSSKLAAG
jgi:putative membrane protein